MRPVTKNSIDQSVVIRIIDSTDGTPENAVEHDTSGIDLWYRREGATKTSITEVALAALDTAHTDGGIELIGDGYYRLDPPDAAFATGANGVMVGGTVTGMIVIGCYVPLVDYDPQDSVRMGMTALPNAAADAAGGLAISDTGGLDIDTFLGRITANVAIASVCTEARLAELDAANIPADLTLITAYVDELESRLTALRAGYLDNLNGHTPQTGDNFSRIGAPVGASISADIATRAPSGEYDTELDATVSSRSSHTAASVWAVGTRTLTSFGTLIADIWSYVTRALTDKAGFSLAADQSGVTVGTVNALGAQAKLDVNAECDTALTDYDPPTRAEATADKDAIITEVNANETKIDAVQADVTTVKGKTDALPSGIAKNVALPFFDFYMLLTNGLTAATGKTVTGLIRKDNGSFAAITNLISEVGSGLYAIASGFTQAEMNADKVTLKFTADDCKDTIMVIYTT